MTETIPAEVIEKMAAIAALSKSVYTTTEERAALRCGLSDAAGLCDALAMAVEAAHRSKRTGATTVKGIALGKLLHQCGDRIMEMREMIDVPPRAMIAARPKVP